MIILALYEEEDERTGRKTGQRLVSHGINTETLSTVTLTAERPGDIGWFNTELGEWVLNETASKK